MPSLPSLRTQFGSSMYDSRKQANKELWHRRLRHLGYDNLVNLKNNLMVERISMPAQGFKEQQQQRPFCEACTLAKQQRLPLQDSDSKCSRSLKLVHIDVCGPLQVTSYGDVRYLATFVDDCSRLTHVVSMKHKPEVASRILISLWETHLGNCLKAMRTDRGKEYVNSELQG